MAGKAKVKTNAIVTRVIDGDTVEVKLKVRLNRIDAPEKTGIERPMGIVALNWLKKRLTGKEVRLEIHGHDKYYRVLSEVIEDGKNVGDEMLDQKIVEIYSRENHNDGELDV